MPNHRTTRYCADPEAISAMKRDGFGWGHDLECGCFDDVAHSTTPGLIARVLAAFKTRT